MNPAPLSSQELLQALGQRQDDLLEQLDQLNALIESALAAAAVARNGALADAAA
ncbi:MAG: hypothetical protein KF688_02390 [Pirellulales bacterium]|nr:hypothetical protein [Pirellulales bacterium]MBX3435299.1 hypothetical protein [Pirellulales bacterium]